MLEELDQLKEAAERTRTLERGEVREGGSQEYDGSV